MSHPNRIRCYQRCAKMRFLRTVPVCRSWLGRCLRSAFWSTRRQGRRRPHTRVGRASIGAARSGQPAALGSARPARLDPRFGYSAEVVHVIDGDTFEARVAVWPGIEISTPMVQVRIDAPEPMPAVTTSGCGRKRPGPRWRGFWRRAGNDCAGRTGITAPGASTPWSDSATPRVWTTFPRPTERAAGRAAIAAAGAELVLESRLSGDVGHSRTHKYQCRP